MKKEIYVCIDGSNGVVSRKAYVKAKTKQLIEFGYPTLTEEVVDSQIDALIAGKKFGEGLTIIGMFMDKEVIIDKTKELK